MASKKSFKVYVNDEDFKDALQDLDPAFIEKPAGINKDTLAVILRFLDEKGGKDYLDVFPLLDAIKGLDVPAIILDHKLIPAHSKQVWLYKNTVRYLPLDDLPTAWSEVRRYLSARIKHLCRADEIPVGGLYDVGWSVSIKPKDYAEYNLVSLFVGSMGDFMVELKLLLDTIRPDKLEGNPLKNKKFEIIRAMEFEWALRHNKEQHSFEEKTHKGEEMKNFLSDSGARELFDREPKAPTRNHIIIEGETGTGKSIIAEFIHNYIYGPFHKSQQGELNKVSCANLGEKIMETQLFGSMEGAYTDAKTRSGAILEAYNGTVFLDEIGELSPELQARLLYYVESQTIQPEGWKGKPIYVPSLIVAATNKRLEEEVKGGRFRRDLHHRLGFTVTIPPQRNRVGDLERLIDFILQNPMINPVRGKKPRPVQAIEKDAVEFLRQYDFPGNFRELEQIIRRAVIRTQSCGLKVITEEIIKQCMKT